MEHVTVSKTRGGSPKYCLLDIPMAIRVAIDSENSCRIFISSKEVDYTKITGKSSDQPLYITSVKEEEYKIFCKSLIYQIRSLCNRNVSLQTVFTEIYHQYRNEESTKEEVGNLQNEFKKLNKTYKKQLKGLLKTSEEMDIICKKMEML